MLRQLIASSRSGVGVELTESDACNTNKGIVSKRHQNALSWQWICCFHFWCLIHQLYLIVGLLAVVLSGGKGLKLVGLLYATSKLSRQAGYHERLIRAVPHVVELCLVIRRPTGGHVWDPAYRMSVATFDLLSTAGYHCDLLFASAASHPRPSKYRPWASLLGG